MDFRSYLDLIDEAQNEPEVGDLIELELGDVLIETTISEISEDGVFVHLDETALRLMIDAKKQLNERMVMGVSSDASSAGSKVQGESEDVTEYTGSTDKEKIKKWRELIQSRSLENFPKARDQFAQGAKLNHPKEKFSSIPNVDNLEEVDMDEAKYQGREVPLGKPMAGDVKKSKVYVRGPKGNVVKVNFGDKNMRIKKSNPNRRKSFRARHRCENPGPRWKARYWSCRAW